MKKLNNIFAAGVIMVFVTTACDQEQTSALSRENEAALSGMKEAYESAVIENTALKIAIHAGNSSEIHKVDSAFHYHINHFVMQHTNYMHNGAHDDHFHNGQGMRGMNTMMGNHQQWKDSHHTTDHELMDKLINDHNLMAH
jgi:hypothetical protein